MSMQVFVPREGTEVPYPIEIQSVILLFMLCAIVFSILFMCGRFFCYVCVHCLVGGLVGRPGRWNFCGTTLSFWSWDLGGYVWGDGSRSDGFWVEMLGLRWRERVRECKVLKLREWHSSMYSFISESIKIRTNKFTISLSLKHPSSRIQYLNLQIKGLDIVI